MKPKTLTLYVASLETRNFTFEGFGATRGDAFDAIEDGLATHALQYGIGMDWVREMMRDVGVRAVRAGRAYRDRQLLPSPATTLARETK